LIEVQSREFRGDASLST